MAQPLSTKASDPSLPLRVDVTSNSDPQKSVGLVNGFVRLKYYESILSNSVSATAVIVEAGLTDTKLGAMSILDGLPVRGGEQVDFVIEDNQAEPNSLHFTPKSGGELYVNRIRNMEPGTQKNIYFMDLCNREFITNEH